MLDYTPGLEISLKLGHWIHILRCRAQFIDVTTHSLVRATLCLRRTAYEKINKRRPHLFRTAGLVRHLGRHGIDRPTQMLEQVEPVAYPAG